MSRRKLGCLLVCVAACGATISAMVVAVREFRALSHRLNAEYITAEVIRDVTEYVKTHEGQWPRSWEDFPHDDRAPRYVQLDFDADIEALMDDPERIHSSILPVTGGYRTYPHAAWQLEELRWLLLQFHRPPGPRLE